MAAQEQQMPMLKISILHYRDQSKDEETWIKWYLEEQIPRFIPIAHRHGIDRCELYVTPQAFKEKFQVDLDELKGGCAEGWTMAPYDAATIYWVTDPQKLRNMLADPEWNDKVVPFEKGWIDQHKVDVQAGTQTTYIEEGNIVNVVPKSYD
ncbi:hypothetical protein B0I35DRAFT_445523 [Stachybotrys elegans]|uniref:EthD domain-containing protein n=1 Tax=Stachybotrys elegans TaxID=80388 RepID=A0A8K0SHJ0_9HYPO|nr:hypothetical protein B0I35DRAFT_445523 [Stachybotrys elegans]